MKEFLIGGTIIDDSAQAWAYEDVTPSQVRAVLGKLEDNEPITFKISSPGGSVTAGIAIANIIREASKKRHCCTAHVCGIAASMASVIACACDEIELDESAFMMIHNPWTVAQGDADDLRKEADVLDQMKKAIISFYRSKFDKSEEEIVGMMDAETWFTGANAEDFGFKAKVIKADEPLKAAACARSLPGFAKIPEGASPLLVLGSEVKVEQKAEEVEIVVKAVPADDGVVTSADGSENADQNAEPVAPVEPEVKQDEPKAEAEDPFKARLAAAMKSRDTEINALKAKIVEIEKKAVDEMAAIETNFKDQLAAQGKELTEAKAEVTRLYDAVKKVEGELQETASALAAKEQALAMLNAAVNEPAKTVAAEPEPSREVLASLPAAERAAYYRKHADVIDAK